MNMPSGLIALALSLLAQAAIAQGSGGPPPQAFEDCRGKKMGDVVQHMTREGKIPATCENSPDGLIARPTNSLSPAQPTSARQSRSGFTLISGAGINGGVLPVEYSCDGAGASPALQWSNVPAGTKEFALMISTIPVDGATRWNWVLFSIPKSATGLARNTSGVGVLGATSHDLSVKYEPLCPNGPGAKLYTITVYALSASPALPDSPGKVTGAVLTRAINSITLDSASINLSYTRR
ncbi:MAG: YbhB/YbcL family Raf kinase inhibitor-like protein [Betaproteobacteria bacterium]